MLFGLCGCAKMMSSDGGFVTSRCVFGCVEQSLKVLCSDLFLASLSTIWTDLDWSFTLQGDNDNRYDK